MNAVSPGYFATMGIPLLLGRDFRSEDNPAVSPEPKPRTWGKDDDNEPLPPPAPVAIVNEAFAKKFFGNQSAVGRHLTQGDKFDMAKSFEIVGVVKNSKYFELRKEVDPMVYGSSVAIRSVERSVVYSYQRQTRAHHERGPP